MEQGTGPRAGEERGDPDAREPDERVGDRAGIVDATSPSDAADETGADGPGTAGGPENPPVLVAPVVWAMEQLVGWATGRPATVRWDTALTSAVRGRVDRVTVGVTDLRVGRLDLDRVVLRTTDVRLRPGVPPRIVGGPVDARVMVRQRAVDAWVGSSGLPFRLELTEGGLRSTTGLASLRFGELLTALTVRDGWLKLRPVGSFGRVLPDLVGTVFTGNLPLPELPEQAELVEVEHRPGALVARLSLGELDEPIDPGVARRLRARLEAAESTW